MGRKSKSGNAKGTMLRKEVLEGDLGGLDGFTLSRYGAKKQARRVGMHRCDHCGLEHPFTGLMLRQIGVPRCPGCGGTMSALPTENDDRKVEPIEVIIVPRSFRCKVCGINLGGDTAEYLYSHLECSEDCLMEYIQLKRVRNGIILGTVMTSQKLGGYYYLYGLGIDGYKRQLDSYKTLEAAQKGLRMWEANRFKARPKYLRDKEPKVKKSPGRKSNAEREQIRLRAELEARTAAAEGLPILKYG